jgi:phage tail sheath protein FI
MAEVVYSSAGVSSIESDSTTIATSRPVGIPAGVIGTSNLGPAFVPVTVGSIRDFFDRFGTTDGEKFGPLAVSEWLRNAQACTFTRVLGAGDGKRRDSSTGKVNNAGFVVGDQIVQASGYVSNNRAAVYGGPLGRTYFLGCFMSESAGSTIFSEAGIQISGENISRPIIRGVLMAPSGVVLSLSGNNIPDSGAPSTSVAATTSPAKGGLTGSVNDSNLSFVMLLNGFSSPDGLPTAITASFDTKDESSYFYNVFNRDPRLLESRGHVLYAAFDIPATLAAVTGSGALVGSVSSGLQDFAFITTGSLGRNSSNSTSPNYEQFEDRFAAASTPFFVSQDFGGTRYDLFSVESISDGAFSNTAFKISIENIAPDPSTTNPRYGTFDLVVREFSDTDSSVNYREEWRGLSMNPSSPQFFARVIGNQKTFFDFDKVNSSQRLVVQGDFPNRSKYIRVVVADNVLDQNVPATAIPFGFRGPSHLVTSGSTMLTNVLDSNRFSANDTLNRAIQPPIPMRTNVATGLSPNKIAAKTLYWGVQFNKKTSVDEPNAESDADNSILGYTKYFPGYSLSGLKFSAGNNAGTADVNGSILDADRFNNNLFSLDKIQVVTASNGVADPDQWLSASYIRGGNIAVNDANKTRALQLSDFGNSSNRGYSKFTVFMQGGFDGVNIFDKEKSALSNTAVKRENDDTTNQGGISGPTVSAYRKAVDIINNKFDFDIKLLAIPGIRHTSVTDYAISAVESRFDAMYIMDVDNYDTRNIYVTSSAQSPSVDYTVNAFNSRGIDSSFAAAYFPDVNMTDPTTRTLVTVPATVAVLGAFSLNDSRAFPWFAPAGFARGALSTTVSSPVTLNKQNLDTLYSARINPITKFEGTGFVVWGQKTLQVAANALDRVNVRRLLIEIRRAVRNVGNSLLFEPNRSETLQRFSTLVNPIMQSIQERSGLDRYKVVIDTSTTTQADIENNTIRGQIYVQPTRSIEFVSLSFEVRNAGTY